MTNTKEVRSVQVPLGLIESIKTTVKHRLGYITIAEYVREAIREKLQKDQWQIEEIEKRERESQNIES